MPDPRKNPVEHRQVGRTVHRLREGIVPVASGPLPFSLLVGEPAEIGIGQGRMGVDREGQDVAPPIEDHLVPVPVVVVQVQDRHGPELAQVLGRGGGVVEITEAPEGAGLCVVSRRPHEGIGQPDPLEDQGGAGQCTVDGPLRRYEGFPVEGRERVDAVVPRPDGQLHRRPGLVADWKVIGVHGAVGGQRSIVPWPSPWKRAARMDRT
jgi:hypothetical protein